MKIYFAIYWVYRVRHIKCYRAIALKLLIISKNVSDKSYVPEVLNVQVNESKKNLLFLERFFFQAVKNYFLSKKMWFFFNTFLNLNSFYLSVVFFVNFVHMNVQNFSYIQKFQCSRRPSYWTTLFFYRWRRWSYVKVNSTFLNETMYFSSMTLLPILRRIQRPTTQGHSSHTKYGNSRKIETYRIKPLKEVKKKYKKMRLENSITKKMSNEPSLYYDGFVSYDFPKIQFCLMQIKIFRYLQGQYWPWRYHLFNKYLSNQINFWWKVASFFNLQLCRRNYPKFETFPTSFF